MADETVELIGGGGGGGGATTVVQSFELGSFEFDCALEEAHESSISITDNPMESGASATDHSYVNPVVCSVHGRMLTYDPVNGGGSDSRPTEAYDYLVYMQKTREPLTIISNIKQYQNMLLQSIQLVKNEEDGAIFTMTFREIIISDSETVEGLVVKPPSANGGEKKETKPDGSKKDGKASNQSKKPDAKGKTQPKAEEPKKDKSAAKGIGDIIRGL